ncbi:MAG: hypothetical protein VSS75_022535, partial [Candidatus Parabeggiatoa sp.]|nr:hypothetical protein [Candidatus Parabeggiatoa sp.]
MNDKELNQLDIIDYQQLVTDYNEALVNVLRGFRPKYEFLDIWVPDAEPDKSILNLLEAAQIEGENEVSLFLEEKLLDELDIKTLIQEASKLGEINTRETEQGFIFQVSGLIGEQVSHQNEAKLEECNPLYRTQLMEREKNIQHEYTLTDDDVHLLIHANHQGISLFALFDVQQHKLIQATFASTASAIEKALLEALCQLIEGLPIQEIYDHGLLKLEYALRDQQQPLPVSGIINRFNFDPLFQLPQHLIRQLFHNYCEQTGYQTQLNYFDSPPSQDWLKWDDKQRIQKVQGVLDDLISQSQYRDLEVKVKYIDKTVKVHVEIRGTVSAVEEAALMLNMEKDLHKQVEP